MNLSRPCLRVLAPALLLATAASSVAAPPVPSGREAQVVDAAWLRQHLADPDLVIFHVGPEGDYAKSHIPGARLVTLGDIATGDHGKGGHTEEGLMLEMPPPDDLRRRLSGLGISDGSRVVVYWDDDWVSPATRVVFTLDHAGLGERTRLLDGGLKAWKKAGGAVTGDVPPARQGTLAPLKTRPLVVDADFVRAHLNTPGFAVVDARDAVYYDAVETGGMRQHPHRTGHIAGALTLPFGEMVDDQNRLRSSAEWQALFTRAGVKKGDTVLAYCHIGQQATAVLFAARALGHPVLLYDGSFQDWSRRPGFPVDNPAGAKR
jgi:thiosulfate/3-mercaptopyruvate sulfurtransferase